MHSYQLKKSPDSSSATSTTNQHQGNYQSRQRSKYKMHSTKLKEQAIQVALQQGVKQAAIKVGAPAKSVKRWLKVGPYRKNAATVISSPNLTADTPTPPSTSNPNANPNANAKKYQD